jgi:DNA polymerase-3 subunit gamma/tau
MIGQPHVLKALVNSIKTDRIHHAYLFTGTRGIGKTTVARIFAKCLNCHSNITMEPCGHCASCEEINNGSGIDLIEIDAASRTKVEDTRELLANTQYAPIHSRFKIYLIDEVHMLSLQSFNALLKTLEEPPEHVKFLLATTDPQKIPVTILSRCLQFHLKQMTPASISNYIEQVLIKENIHYEVSALNYIAKAANGSMRDALSITDQAIAYTDCNLTSTEVANMLGSVDSSILIDILHAVAKKNIASAINLVRSLAEHSPDFSLVFDDLLGIINNLALMQVDEKLCEIPGQHKLVFDLARLFTAEELQLFYQIIVNAKQDASIIEDSKSIFEMAILRMIAFSPEQVEVTDYPTDTQQQETNYKPVQTIASAYPNTNLQPHDNFSAKTTQATEEINHKQPEAQPTQDQDKPTVSTKQQQSNSPINTNVKADDITVDNWHLLFFKLNLAGMARSILINCSYVSYQQNHLQLCITQEHNDLLQQEHQQELRNALKQYFKKEISVEIIANQHNNITPYQWLVQYKKQQIQNATNELVQDNAITSFINSFNAELIPDSVTINN